MIDAAVLRDLEEERAEQMSAAEVRKLSAQAKSLERANDVLNCAVNNMARGLSMFGPDRRLIACNGLYRDFYGLPESLVVPGTPLEEIVTYFVARETKMRRWGDYDFEQWVQDHNDAVRAGRSFSQDQHMSDGRVIRISVQPLSDGGWVDTQEDITDQVRTEERALWLANHCALTQVANRSHLRTYLDDAIAALQPGRFVALHLIDADYFRQVNESFGHSVGDAVLQELALRIRSAVRGSDTVGRLGGDEFAIVQANLTSIEQASALAERVVNLARQPFDVDGCTARMGASVGIAVASDQMVDGDTLFRQADVALDSIKYRERGGVELYSGQSVTSAKHRIDLDKDVRQALSRDQMQLYYQPIVDVSSGKVHACEALLRWQRADGKLVSPDDFIPVAERLGCIVDMGAWTLKKACQDALGWSLPCKVAVNISPLHFEKGDIVEDVTIALEESGLPPERLEIEITETMQLKTDERTLQTLSKLKRLGVKVALDDFGTAFASLGYLTQFSFDKIKIDRSFVRKLEERKDCRSIVQAVAGLATALELSVVTEGVETPEQLVLVRAAGCHLIQGHYFGRAVRAEELEAAFSKCEDLLAELPIAL